MIEQIEQNGRTFDVKIEPDDDIGPPWVEYDCTGIVSDWRRHNYAGQIPQSPGERILWRDRDSALVYDWSGTIAKAKKERWGLCDEDIRLLANELGREPTRGQIIERSVQKDFDRLRRYCSGDWHHCTVIVTDPVSGLSECLGGVESDCEDYIEEIARELAAEIPEPEFCSCCGQITNN